MNFSKRRTKLSEKLLSKDTIDSIVITSPSNLRYLFNYPGRSFERFACGLLTVDGSDGALVVPKLDEQKAEESDCDKVFAWSDSEGYKRALGLAGTNLGLEGTNVGCELGITMGQMDQVKDVLGTKSFVSISEEISKLREVKDRDEIESIKSSARILKHAFDALPHLLRARRRESEVALELRNILLEKGAEYVGFCAVQSGSNSAIPHSEATAKLIEIGDMIVVDVTCTDASGYHADFTRTFVVGRASAKQKEVYSVVKRAQSAGVRSLSSGQSAEEVDRVARRVIEESGFGEFFIHRTGHGIGLEEHELPWVKEGSEEELERGMALTIEPGIYLPHKFGVRIEDDLIIEKRGAANVTHLNHDLVELA